MNTAKDKAKTAETPQLVKVKLAKGHTHAGVDYAPKTELEVDAATAEWLAKNGVTEKPKQTAAPSA